MKTNNSYTHECKSCKGQFISNISKHHFCSKACRKVFYNKVNLNSLEFKIPTGTTGAISEHIATAYLMKLGYNVFKAASPCCFCDLFAIKGKEKIMCEVRTGYRDSSGQLTFGKAINNSNGNFPTHYLVVLANSDETLLIKISKEQKEKYSRKTT